MTTHRAKVDMTSLARSLRRSMTAAERALWGQLRAKRFADAKFNRQVPVDRYITDFCSFEHRLIIEVDGGQHDVDRNRDRTRTEYLEGQGFKVIRFWNTDVLKNLEGVMFSIEKALQSEMRNEVG